MQFFMIFSPNRGVVKAIGQIARVLSHERRSIIILQFVFREAFALGWIEPKSLTEVLTRSKKFTEEKCWSVVGENSFSFARKNFIAAVAVCAPRWSDQRVGIPPLLAFARRSE
jgi:hypothetical protein